MPLRGVIGNISIRNSIMSGKTLGNHYILCYLDGSSFSHSDVCYLGRSLPSNSGVCYYLVCNSIVCYLDGSLPSYSYVCYNYNGYFDIDVEIAVKTEISIVTLVNPIQLFFP